MISAYNMDGLKARQRNTNVAKPKRDREQIGMKKQTHTHTQLHLNADARMLAWLVIRVTQLFSILPCIHILCMCEFCRTFFSYPNHQCN